MADYTPDAIDALNDIKEDGRKVVMARTVGEIYDEEAGSTTLGVRQTSDAYCLVFPASKGTIQGFDNLTDASVLEKRRFLLMAAHGLKFEPESGTEIDFDGHTWVVMGYTSLNIDGTPILHRVGVQR